MRVIVILLLVLSLGYSNHHETPLSPTFYTDSVQPIWDNNCTGCHADQGPGWWPTGAENGGLDLSEGVSYGLLVGVESFLDTMAPKRKRVEPGNSAASSLYNKVISDFDNVWFGTPMPAGYALINTDSAAVDIIKRWIDSNPTPIIKKVGYQNKFSIEMDKDKKILVLVSRKGVNVSRFDIYNVRGKLVGSSKNEISYENLIQGIYFIKPIIDGKEAQPIKYILNP